MICGRATAIMVELSGASMVASAVVARIGVYPRSLMVAWVLDDTDDPRVAVDLDRLPVPDRGGRATGPDHGRDAVLAGDDRAVAEDAAGVGHHRRGRRE